MTGRMSDMADKKIKPSSESGIPFYTLSSLSSNGLFYNMNHEAAVKNELKNAYNTDVARERGLVPETEDDEGLKKVLIIFILPLLSICLPLS
jgi:hypothetical protein